MTSRLTTENHDRDAAGLNYVYPVISRRSGGLSIGVNFNTNNACNWRCVYCQVPDLKLGAAPPVDLALLEHELKGFLAEVQQGSFYERFGVEANSRVIKDIAISGNGEPSSADNFAEAVALIGQMAKRLGIFPASRFVLITNGSLMHQSKVQDGLQTLNAFGGEVWFKFDSVTPTGRERLNRCAQTAENSLRNLKIAAGLCHTKLQTCVLDYDGAGLTEQEITPYLDALKGIKETTPIDEVMLYTLARPSLQPEAERLRPLARTEMECFAERIRSLGYRVSVSV